MNFVLDMPALAFITAHAESRDAADPAGTAARVLAAANSLAGEPFGPDTQLTQLSGGQSRALMIADTALLSRSPVLLIDEIENAGVDKRKALDLLLASDKIVVVATHDPVLALARTAGEAAILARLAGMEEELSRIRAALRGGEVLG
jgi:ABC-type lipoprotein export system ATPase subunit